MAKKDPSVDLLGNVDLFRDLTPKELRVVHAQSKEMSFRDGQVVVAEGEKPARFYLILDGRAKVDVGGRKRPPLRTGDYFGEISLIDGGPRTATITADGDLNTLTIASFNFRSLLKEHPPMALKLLVTLCRRVRNSEQPRTH
jgi:CRP/FNR family transcriptional regulator, cyclic AMP receptor protein